MIDDAKLKKLPVNSNAKCAMAVIAALVAVALVTYLGEDQLVILAAKALAR